MLVRMAKRAGSMISWVIVMTKIMEVGKDAMLINVV